MAENKNGFVLYKDLINVVKKLVLKDRENKTNYGGELFLLILEYVNDENPIPIDFIIEMTFEPIKAQLKRDLKKYETKINKNSEAGRIGNLKRWHPDLFLKYEKGLLTLIKAEEIADGRKCDKSIAKIADTDTVTDTDIDTDILLKKETKEIPQENSIEDDLVNPETEQRKKVAQKKEIEYPFPTKEFKASWDLWKAYRKKKDKFQYFDELSEQKALTELFNLSKENQQTALAIIRQSIDHGWKGFFELKNTTNGNTNNANSGFNTSKNGNGKVSGSANILAGIDYQEFA